MEMMIAIMGDQLARQCGPQPEGFVLSRMVGDERKYFHCKELPPRNFIGIRPSRAFELVNSPAEATRYDWWLTAWYHRRSLQRSLNGNVRISIEPVMPAPA